MTVKVDKNDARYPSLTRGNNPRWQGNPKYVFLPESREEIKQAFIEARNTSDGSFATRCGGHCYIDSVDRNTEKYSVIDLGLVNRIYYDEKHKAISVDAGCRLGEVYKYLFRRWGVTLPGGSCGTVGVGGHISGGGYGLLSRLYGVTVDHLWGVEVVTASGEVKLGHRDAKSDTDEYKLWWAHTGGGGGNFGLVTRFLLRSNDKDDAEIHTAADCLPKAPARVELLNLKFPWLKNNDWLRHLTSRYATWCQDNALTTEDTATDRIFGLYRVKTPGSVAENHALHLTVQVAQLADNEKDQKLTQKVLDEFRRDIGVEAAKEEWRKHAPEGATGVVDLTEDLPWLEATQILSGGDWENRAKQKSAYHLELTKDHRTAMLDNFEEHGLEGRGDRRGGQGALAQLDTYGGAINRTESMETAYSHRDSSIKIQYQSYWHDAGDDHAHLTWLNDAYSKIYQSEQNGGFPQAAHEFSSTETDPDMPNTDGCFVNYLDDDLKTHDDPHLYTKLYWGPDTFDQLQTIKQHVDPNGVFTSAQPIPHSKH